MADTFTCDRCGREFPTDQLKEVFVGEGDEEQKLSLCPEDLDKVMNETSGEVKGVEGDEKRRAAHIGDEQPDDRDTFGARESG